MKKKFLKVLATGLLMFGVVGMANANPIELTWTSTVSSFYGSVPTFIGETITTTITVDNGGSSTLSQSWTDNDFSSYLLQGASGWWMGNSEIDTTLSSGIFSTDALGDVITASNWRGKYWSSGTINTSWSGAVPGGWWNNGLNEVAATYLTIDGVNAANVEDNLIGRNWTATAADPIPEPTTMLLLGTA